MDALSEWLETSGGPVVVVPASRRSSWRGAGSADYRDACAVERYAGVMHRSSGSVLVLGDEPLRTATLVRRDGVAILRWIFAPDEETLVDAALHLDVARAPVAERIGFTPSESSLVLFDAADAGAAADALELHAPEGAIEVITHVIQDDARQVAFVLHRFARTSRIARHGEPSR